MYADLYVTADEAAQRLGVSVATIYAYVSRKQIRARRLAGASSSLYWRADVERLASRWERTEPPPLPEQLVESSALTLITDCGHFYRGLSALELAKTETLEAVAGLLWGVDANETFSAPAPSLPEGFALAGHVGAPLQRAILALSLLELQSVRSYDLTQAGYARSGAVVLRLVATVLLDGDRPTDEPIHEFIVRQLGAPAEWAGLVRHLLVLAADHELDPTAYAVRAAANTGVTPYAAVIAGLVSSTGRRLTFGRADSLHLFLRELMSAPEPRDVIIRRLREGESLPGFASKNYAAGDPRAESLLDQLRIQLSDDPELMKLQLAIETAFEATGARPDFVLPAVFLGRRIGLKLHQGSLVRIGRLVGWIAHALEQYAGRDLVRPHARYAGALPELA